MMISLFSPILILLVLIAHAIADEPSPPPFRFSSCSNDKGNYTANSTYHSNLHTLLSSLPSNESYINNYGAFVSSSYGEKPDTVYALALCRGDVDPVFCRSCLTNSTNRITQVDCPNQKEAIGWYSECMLRYSNRSIYGIMETYPGFFIYITQNATSDADAFQQEVRSLFEDLRIRAATGGSLRKFAAGNRAAADNTITIYGIAQCTPDLSDVDCSDCLVSGVEGLGSYTKGSRASWFGMPSCSVLYDLYRFYNASFEPPSPPPQSPPPPPPLPVLSPPPPLISPPTSTNGTSNNGKNKMQTYQIVIVVVVPVLALTAIVFCICIHFPTWKAKRSVECKFI